MQDKRKNPKNEHGIALILVLGILAVLVTLATTFAFNMRLEQKAARNYLDTVTVDCIARIGVEYAIALLRNDITEPTFPSKGYDWNGDTWGYRYDGSSKNEDRFCGYEDGGDYCHKNLDDYGCTEGGAGYGGTDAQWIGVKQDGVLVGRYAVLVIDEASKMNINTAGNIASGGSHGDNEGWTTAEIDLESLSDFVGLGDDIVKYRYGSDNDPGDAGDDNHTGSGGYKDILHYDGIDNDGDKDDPGDGSQVDEVNESIDEPDEYTPWYPRDDDEVFSTIRQIRLVSGITSKWGNIKNLITVHSRTRNQYWDDSTNRWEDRININAEDDVRELSTLLNGALVSNPYQKACNIIDYRDENIILSSIYNAVWIYGIEPILINEVLANSYMVADDIYTNDTGNWQDFDYGGLAPNTCYRIRIYGDSTGPAPYASFNVRVGGGAGELLTSGSYVNYSILASCSSDVSGQVQIGTQDPTGADSNLCRITEVRFTCAEFVELCNISSGDGDKDGVDGIDLTNWTITVGNKTSTIPAGDSSNPSTNVIDPGSYFILTNDPELFDYSYGVTKNGSWGDANEDIPLADMSAIPIVADRWVPGAGSKWNTEGELADPDEPSSALCEDIILRDSYDLITERVVNADLNSSDYGSSNNIGVSKEKDDPTDRNDWADNGKATAQASPAINSATNELNDRVDSVTHTDMSELYIKNYPFASVGEMSDYTNYKGVRSGDADWDEATYRGVIHGNVSTDDLGKFAERVTTDYVRLDAETASHTNADGVGTHWNTAAAGPYLTDFCVSPDNAANETSYWEWRSARLQPVAHTLYIYGLYANDIDTGYLDVYVANYSGTTYSFPGLPTDGGDGVEFKPSDGLKIGTISTGNIGSDGRFAIQLVTDDSKTTHNVYFDYLLLVPESMPGKLNLNTAWVDVLDGLPGISTAMAQDIYDNAHGGSPYTKLGDVLGIASINASVFAPISNLVSVHSDVFQIICLAQAIKDMGASHVNDTDNLIFLAEKKVRVIVDRSSLDMTSGAIKTLYWEEMRD